MLTVAASLGACAPRRAGDTRFSMDDALTVPRYTAEGALIRPEGWASWVFVGASIGLSYSEDQGHDPPRLFHNVYMQPAAYEHYARTGVFPEKTMFVLSLYRPEQKEAILRGGFFEGELVRLEVGLKDHSLFEEGWAYFDFGEAGSNPTATPFPAESCHTCHAEHGADDNVFVQFYPTLRALREGRSP